EQAQTTTAAVNPNGMSGVSIVSNTSGNMATIAVQVIGLATNHGYNNIILSGTDNGTPPQTTSTPVVIHVFPSPLAAFTFSPSSPVQTGTTVTFTNTSDAGISYSWDFGDGSATSSVTHPTHIYYMAGTYLITLTATDGICSDQYQMPIVVRSCLNLSVHSTGSVCP